MTPLVPPETTRRSTVRLLTLCISFLVALSSCSFFPDDYSTPDSRSSSVSVKEGLIVVNNNDPASLNTAISEAINDTKCDDGCVIDIRETGTISLSDTLNKIEGVDKPIWIVGDDEDTTTINGNDHQHFYVGNGAGSYLALQKVTLNNGKVKGGDAETGAGGGLGAGGAMFINNGLVILDHAAVTNSEALKGVSNGDAGQGGNGDKHEGKDGGAGARMNKGARFVPADTNGGGAGEGGDTCKEGGDICDAQDKQHGDPGEFGRGGGSAGGGGGDGGADDDGEWPDSDTEPGRGGSGGSGGQHGQSGSGGDTPCNKCNTGASGGAGGDGAGLGGGIFVRHANGARIIVNNSDFSGNNASTTSDALHVHKNDSEESKGNTSNLNYNNSSLATLSLALVDINGEPTERVIEGERAILVIKVEDGSLPNEGGADVPVYMYLSDLDALAEKGSGNITNDDDADFAWNGSNLIKLMLPAGHSGDYYVNLPDADGTNALGAYAGIQTYIDKKLEGDETFTVSLLVGEDYQLADDNTSQEIIIEDANYQVSLLGDSDMNHTAICDAADALEQAADDPASDCKTGGRATEIDVDDLKGLGYVTVQAKRPVGVQRPDKSGELPDGWQTTDGQYSSLIIGELFNNGLAGGLPVHYALSGKPDGVFTNQVNYNNENYEGIDGELDALDGAQIFNAVVIPVTDLESDEPQPLPPGAARIYFSALPDAVQEASQSFELTLATFPNDPSYDPENFCNEENESYCEVLENTPAGKYKYYSVHGDTAENSATLIVHDSGEFTAGLVVIDNINGEVVTDAQDSTNPLLIDDQGDLAFWLKLGSQPTDTVDVTVNGDTFTFDEENWQYYQPVTIASGDWTADIDLTVSSNDSEYSSGLNRTLVPRDDATRIKIKEAAIPAVAERYIEVGIRTTVEDYVEGSLDYPQFDLVLGQPLPFVVEVAVSADLNGDVTTHSSVIPAWQQVSRVTVPVMNNDLVDGVRTLTTTVTDITAPGGQAIQNISIALDMSAANVVVKDDEQATVLITQHLPDAPTRGDIARLLPDVEILGISASGNLQVQHNDSRLKEIVISPLGEGDSGSNSVTQQGLLYELITDESVEEEGKQAKGAAREGGYDYITLKEEPYKAQINEATDPFGLASIPQGHIVRQRGYLVVDQDGEYTFTFNAPADQKLEVWLNPRDDDNQNIGMILPYLDGTENPPANTSQPVTLNAGTRYYIEALYSAPEATDGVGVAVQIQFEPASGGTRSSPVPIPLEWLSPANIDGGFTVEVFDGIGTESIDKFMQSQDFIHGNASRIDILTDKLEIPASDAAIDVGRRISVTLTAPEHGEYQFALASDGDSILYALDDDGNRNEIAWVKGNEKYADYTIEKVQDDFVGNPITRAKFSLRRYGDDITASTNWKIEYDIADGMPGTLPYGDPGVKSVTMYRSMDTQDENEICVEDHLTSSVVIGFNGTEEPAFENTFNFSGPRNCEDEFFEGFDGKQLDLIFLDLADFNAESEYLNLRLDDHLLDLPPDYPVAYDWLWSETPDDEGVYTDGQQNSQQRSATIALQQGKEYRFEIVQINPRHDDHLAVAWQRPSSSELEVIDARYISFARLTLPVTLQEASAAGTELTGESMSLTVKSPPFSYKGNQYQVSSVTLAGDPVPDPDEGATPYQPPGWLEFVSGFAATVQHDSVINSTSATDVALTLQDRTIDPQVVSLTVGQTQRLGFQLKGKPANNANVIVDVAVTYPQYDPVNSALLEFTCKGGGTGPGCLQFTFTSNDWNVPQFLTVEAMAEGPIADESYIPDLSKAFLVAQQRAAKDDSNVFTEDSIEVQIYPDATQNDTTYFAKAQGGDITEIGFTADSISGITVEGEESGSLSWTWQMVDDKTLAGMIGGSDPARAAVRVHAMTEDEATALQSGITDGADPVTFTASVELTSEYYTAMEDSTEQITVSGIRWMVNSADAAQAEVTISNGTPTLAMNAVVTGTASSVTELSGFSYQPADGNRPIIAATATEVLVTEYGELTVTQVDGADTADWQFEANPRPQPDSIDITLHASSGDVTQTIDLTTVNATPVLATSLSALTDFTTPRVVLSGYQQVAEDAGSLDLTVQLMTSDGSEPLQATENMNVYYSVAQPGVTDPGNMALNLAALTGSSNVDLHTARSVVLTEPLVLQNNTLEPFTLEAWINPTAAGDTQGLFKGTKTDGSGIDLMSLEGGELTVPGGFSAPLPDAVADMKGFVVAWQVSESRQALFINGEKVAETDTGLADKAPLALTRIGDNSKGYFNGYIDEVRVWNRARTEQEIMESWLTALVDEEGDKDGLEGYWSFNDFMLLNSESDVQAAELINADGAVIDTELQAVQREIWLVKQSAQTGLDYTGLSSEPVRATNVFALTADQTKGRTTFAIGDLNGDQLMDAVVVNQVGDLVAYLAGESRSRTQQRNALPTFQRVELGHNLGDAVPVVLTDIDGDRDLDILAGLPNARLSVLRNEATAGRTVGSAALLFTKPQSVAIEAPALAALSASRGDSLPALTPAIVGNNLMLLIGNELHRLSLSPQGSNIKAVATSAKVHHLALSKRLNNRQRQVQLVDLDQDGDHDLIVDTLRNKPGQGTGALNYLENYGTDENPVYFPAPRSYIARQLLQDDRYLSPAYRVPGRKYHPFDQVEYHQVVDFNGDGYQDRVVSDNYGQIHVYQSTGYEHVTINAGEDSATISLDIIDDNRVERIEDIQLQLVEGKPTEAEYHFASGYDRAIIEIADNDEPGFIVTESGNDVALTEQEISETGAAVAWLVSLNSQPQRDVTVRLASSNPVNGALVALNGPSGVADDRLFGDSVQLTFTTQQDDWSTPQTVWVKGIDDAMDDPRAPFIFALVGSSGDKVYDKRTAVINAVSVDNNDEALISLDYASVPNIDSSGAVVSGEGQVNTVSVKLNAQPEELLTLTLKPTDRELTLFPQRQLVRALKSSNDQIQQVYARTASATTCDLPSGQTGVLALDDFGNWCWSENGEYRFEQTRFPTRVQNRGVQLEHMAFVIDNSYGSLSTETLSARLNGLDQSDTPPGIVVLDLVANDIVADAGAMELKRIETEVNSGEGEPELVSLVGFAVRPATRPGHNETIDITVTGANGNPTFSFDRNNWQLWQRVDDEALCDGATVSVAATITNLDGTEDYGVTKEMSVADSVTPHLMIQDWRTQALLAEGGDLKSVYADDDGTVVLNVRLATAPSGDVTVTADTGESLTFNTTNFDRWQRLTVEAGSADSLVLSSAGYGTDREFTVTQQPLMTQQGNFFDVAGSLAGNSMTLTFTPDDWQLAQTVAVKAVDDEKVEYTSISTIELLLADPDQAITGELGHTRWSSDGEISLSLKPDMATGFYVEKRLWLTNDDDSYDNHSLDIVVNVTEQDDGLEVTQVTEVLGYVDAEDCVRVQDGCENPPAALTFTEATDGSWTTTLDLSGTTLTGVALQPLAASFLANPPAPIEVSVEDNDRPVVRAGVDLNANENTHPGYFTLSVIDPVGIPGGLGVHYEIFGFNDDNNEGATAETEPPADGTLKDPGPDFQGYEMIKTGTLFIPQDKTRVSLPIFPIDDFTPEESLAARYEKVVLKIKEPTGDGGYGSDQYLLDVKEPKYQTAGVRILDNEEVGLKYVIPMQGLTVDEANFNGFKVGLTSQPQTEVTLSFYNTPVTNLNSPDLSYINASTVTFDNTNWNQWRVIDVQVFENQTDNSDNNAPRFSDLYFTLLDKSDGSQGLDCTGEPTDVTQCEPFFNTMKGALNLSEPDDPADNDAKTIELSDIDVEGGKTATGDYGTITLTPLKNNDGDDVYVGDFVYVLNNGEYGSDDQQTQILEAIATSATNEIYDVFSYEMTPADGSGAVSQQLAVQISSLERINFADSSATDDPATIAFPAGLYGNMRFDFSADVPTYTYTFDQDAFEANLSQTDDWRFTDSFVFEMESGASAEDISREFIAFNISLSKYLDSDGETQYHVDVNGNDAEDCDANGNMLCGSTSARTVNGVVVPETISDVDEQATIGYTVTKVGVPARVPVVTRMSLRDSSGQDLWVDNRLLNANPLFDSNNINGAESLVPVDEVIAGDVGDLVISANGDFTYTVNEAQLRDELETTDLRILQDEFVAQLDDHSRVSMTFVSTLQVYQEQEKLVVTLNGELLSKTDGTTNEFTGDLLLTDENQASKPTVERVGYLSHTIVVREKALPAVVIAEGMAEAMNFLQARFNDASLPVFGRMGGGPTTDTSGDKEEAKAPGFSDRFMTLLETKITAQPHLTSEGLANMINAVLQATFAQYNIPLQVLTIDTEKILMKFSYMYGVSTATDEFKTDWGMPGMGHFSGSAAGTFKITADLVFGVNFRGVETASGDSKMKPKVFVVTDKNTLEALLAKPKTEPMDIYDLKTWNGTSISQNGVQFLGQNDARFTQGSKALEAFNTNDINSGLKAASDCVSDICPQIKWKWKSDNNSMNWELNSNSGSSGGVDDFSTIIGTVTNNGDDEYADFIEISLHQPLAIGPDTESTIQLSVTIDPNDLMKSNYKNNALKKEYLEAVLRYLDDSNTKIQFANKRIQVFDIYTDQNDSDNAQQRLHESQILTLGFEIEIKEEGATDPVGFQQDAWVAKPKLLDSVPDTVVTEDEILIAVDSTHTDKNNFVDVACKTNASASVKCEPYDLEVNAEWKTGGTTTKRFPTDKNAFKSQTSYSETVELKDAKLKLKGKLTGSGNSKKVRWTWELSSLPIKSLDFNLNTNLITLKPIKLNSEQSQSAKTIENYVITRHLLMFHKGDHTEATETVSKFTLDVAGSVEFRGDAQFFAIGGSINQARSAPTNAEAGSLIQPDEVFGRLTGAASAKSTIVALEEDNNNADNPAFVVGMYGVLAISADGSYSYYRRPEIDLENWNLKCLDYEGEPHSPMDASFKALCKDLLALDDNDNPMHWDDPTTSDPEISFKGYTLSCGPYEEVASGAATCQVTSPAVIYVPEDADTLIRKGVTSLETTINTELVAMSSWSDTSNMSNRKTLQEMYDIIKVPGAAEILYGQDELVDTFYISSNSDTAFREVKFTLGAGGGVKAEYNGVPFNGMSGYTFEHEDDEYDAGGWTGGTLNYHEPGIKDILQASSLPIQPMAEANIYLDIALVDPKQAQGDELSGLLYLSELKKPKDIVQYTLGGNASMYAHFNAGIGAPPKETGDDEDYQSFSLPGPSVAANIGLVAQYVYQGKFGDVSSNGGEFIFGAFNLEVDLGEFISEKLVEPLGAMNNFLEPIQPVATALTADMKIFQSLNLTHVFDANLDGKVTVLEIPTPFLRGGGQQAQKYEQQIKTVNRFLEFIASILQMIKIAEDLGDELSGVQGLEERIISVDGIQISPDSIRIIPAQSTSNLDGVGVSLVPYVNQLGHAVLGINKSYQYTKTFGGTVSSSTAKPMEPVKPQSSPPTSQQNTSMSKVKSRYNDLLKSGVISFPILSNPADVLQFIFGDPADLMLIDIPDFYFEFEIEKGWRPPPVPIFKGKISGGLQMKTDTVIGIDTAGFLQAICGSDSPGPVWDCQGELSAGERSIRLFNSVFLRDWNEQSYYAGGDTSSNKVFWQGNERQLPGYSVWDKHELAGNAEVDIGAGLDLGVFGAYFQGGPGLGGGIDLVDLCEATTPEACEPVENGDFTANGTYDGKIRAYDFVMQMINDPMSSFDMGLIFYVDFEAYIETFKIKVWEELIGYFPLFEFTLDGATWVGTSRSASGDPLAGATLYFDSNNNQRLDPGEPMTFTDAKGMGYLKLPFDRYDRNKDGRVDDLDGTIRHFGGMNINSGLGELEMRSVQ